MAAVQAFLDPAYGVTNIKSHIPILLDINDHNYDAWRELFLLHCQSFDVSGHLDGTLLPENDNDAAWQKKDGLVKLWLYGTLSKNLFRSTFQTGGTSREAWIRIENFFRNNKEARAVQLDNKLRTKEQGDLSIHDYCQEMKQISDLLRNLDAAVTERTLVTYMLNGLSHKYDHIINVIIHRQPFPSFSEARNMLMLEEDRLNRGNKQSLHHKDSPSSDKILTASETTSDRKSSPHQNQHHNNNRSTQNRGRGRNNHRGRGRGFNNQPRPQVQQWNAPFWTNGYQFWPQQQQLPPWFQGPQQQYFQQGILGPRPALQIQGPNNGSQKPEPTVDFATAFNTMTLVDPSDAQWYMDSGATAHLSNSTGNLKFTFDLSTGKSVTVANGSSIPIQKAGSISFSTHSRPLSLSNVLVTPSIIKNLISVRQFTRDNSCSIEFDPCGFSVKDLMSKETILRSDSTGDLYPLVPSLNKATGQHSALSPFGNYLHHLALSSCSPEHSHFKFSSLKLYYTL